MYSTVLCESNTEFYQTSSNNLLAVFPCGLQLPHQENLMQSTPKRLCPCNWIQHQHPQSHQVHCYRVIINDCRRHPHHCDHRIIVFVFDSYPVVNNPKSAGSCVDIYIVDKTVYIFCPLHNLEQFFSRYWLAHHSCMSTHLEWLCN